MASDFGRAKTQAERAIGREFPKTATSTFVHAVGPKFQMLWRGMDDVLGEADLLEQYDERVREIQLPPSVTMSGAAGKRVMVVVPAFAVVGEVNYSVVDAAVEGSRGRV